MFETLRIANGGGIQSMLDKAVPHENAVTNCIGIGGTGKDVLRATKGLIYEKIRADNFERCCTEEPVYNCIKFLAIDSDIRPSNPERDFVHVEFTAKK